MTKRVCRTLAVVGLSLAASVAATQPAPPPAATVLANVQRFYAGTRHLTAQFRQVVTNATFNTTSQSDGKVWVAKPDQFRWDYAGENRSFVVQRHLATAFNVALATAPGPMVLELTPKAASAQYTAVRFVVDPADWHVNESIVIDSNGDTDDFRFYAPDVTSAVPASLFQVNPSSLPLYS